MTGRHSFISWSLGFLCLLQALVVPSSQAASQVGQIDTTNGIERVTVSRDGKLYAWDKQGIVISGWPIDLTSQGRVFVYSPRLQDMDSDLQAEILAVSEDSSHNLRFHVFKGVGVEQAIWGFDIPHKDLTETPFIADINQDSSLDIIYGTESGGIHAFRRDFQPIALADSSLGSPVRVAAGDPDNDGQEELFAASGATLYRWNRFGARETFYQLPAGEEILGAPAFVDVTDDAYPEIVFATTGNQILAVNKDKTAVLKIEATEGVSIASPVLIEDIDFDLQPEFLFLSEKNEIIALEKNGSPVTSWDETVEADLPLPTGGIVANDLYRGAFSSRSGWDQLNIYRSKLGGYSRIQLGENVHDWDENAPFNFIEAVEISDVYVFPKLFTPNGDGINDTTEIRYRISEDALVAVDLYDNKERFISRIIEKQGKPAGANSDVWNGVDNRGTLTPNDDVPLDTGLYVLKIVAQSKNGFVTTARVSAIVNGIKVEIEIPKDDDKKDGVYPVVFGDVAVSGIATDPNFGEGNLNADFTAYKLYVRPGIWNVLPAEDVVTAGDAGSLWVPISVPLLHQSPTNSANEPNDAIYPNSNVSTRPVQHGLLGTWNTEDAAITPNGEYTILLKALDSNGNTVGKVNYDLLTVTVRNPNAGDPFDPGNIFDPNNPDNPLYLGPKITNVSQTNQNLSKAVPSTTIGYRLENETAHINISIYGFNGGIVGPVVSSYSFNYRAVGDYTFVWNGQNTLGRNVSGGAYKVRITASAVDGTGTSSDESLIVNVASGFSASDILTINSFTATPQTFRPLDFNGLTPEKSSLHYELTKTAKVSVTIYDGDPDQGGVLKKSLIKDQYGKKGDLFWDGTGDNGIILPVNHDYIARLTGEGIDIGLTEMVHQDITIRLEQQTLNGALRASISELRGSETENIANDGVLRSLVGNSDFLWRATGTGILNINYQYDIGAWAKNDAVVPNEYIGPGVDLTYSRVDGNPLSIAYNLFQLWPREISLTIPSGQTVVSHRIEVRPPLVAPGNVNYTLSASGNTVGASLTDGFVSPLPSFCTMLNGLQANCPSAVRIIATVSGNTECESPGKDPKKSMGWISNQIKSGDGTIQAGSFVGGWISTCDGYDVIPGTTRDAHYYFRFSNEINGNTTVSAFNDGSSNGGYVTVPGIRGWLGNGSGPQTSGGFFTSPDLYVALDYPNGDFDSARDDPYLNGVPYKKIFGLYNNFNDVEFHRYTDFVNIYSSGYQPNIFSGNPGTNLYTFSDAVRITSWGIDVRYPNVTVSKPDGDNALDTGSGALGVFSLSDASTNGTGIIGSQNTNIQDQFRLQLLPNAVPKRFVEIRGSAEANYELFYYDNDEADPIWKTIEPRTSNAVSGGILAHWDVTRLNGENYTILIRSRNPGNGQVNEGTMSVGIGQRVNAGTETRVYSAFKQASLIFNSNSLLQDTDLVTITPVKLSEAAFTLPSGIVPIGPIFDIKPDDIQIDINYPVQLELTFTKDDIQNLFHVDDPSHLTIYNLAGDELLEGLVTVVQVDGDLYRFTANLDHFSQYVLVDRQAGYIYASSPEKDKVYGNSIAISGTVESKPRSSTDPVGPLATVTNVTITAAPVDNSGASISICSGASATFNCAWNTGNLSGNYLITIVAKGPQGADAKKEIEVAIDQQPAETRLLIDGQAIADGASAVVSPYSVIELASDDGQENSWQTGISMIEYRLNGGGYETYAQPFTLQEYPLGPMLIEYHSVDKNGNVETGKSASLTLLEALTGPDAEATDLSLLIQGPSYIVNDQTWVSSNTTFTITASGPDSGSIWYKTGGDTFLAYQSPFTIEVGSLDGSVAVQYYAVNSFGLREHLHQSDVILDKTSPTTTISYSGPSKIIGTDLVVTPDTQFALASIDGGANPAGLSRIEYKIGGGPWKVYSGEFSVPAAATIQYRGIDQVGNTETANDLVVKMDATAPVAHPAASLPIQISPNGDGRFDTAEFKLFVSDNFSSALTASLNINDGTQDYLVIDSLKIDLENPSLIWDGSFQGQLLPEGVYTYTLTVEDLQGNVSDPVTGTMTLDVTPPAIQISGSTAQGFSPTGGSGNNVLQVDYQVTDNLSEDVAVLLEITTSDFSIHQTNQTVSTPPADHQISWSGENVADNQAFDGLYKFKLVATDAAGNRSNPEDGSSTVSGTVILDHVPPMTALKISDPTYDDGTRHWLGRGSQVRLDALDPQPGSGLKGTKYDVGQGFIPYAGPFILSTEDLDVPARYYSTDNVNNQEAEQSVVLRLDMTAPVTQTTVGTPQLQEGEKTWISPKTQIEITADDGAGVGVENIYLQLKGRSEIVTYDQGITLQGLEDGLQTFFYYAKDYLGNAEAAREMPLWLDQTAPFTELAVDGPSYSSGSTLYVSADSILKLIASGERNDVARTEYRLDGGGFVKTNQLQLTGEADRDRSTLFEFHSIDTLGNEEPLKGQTVVVDNLPPVTQLSLSQQAGPGSLRVTPDTLVQLDAADSGSGVAKTEYRIDEGEWVSYTAPVPLKELSAGNHTFEYYSIDNVGHAETLKTASLDLMTIRFEREQTVVPRALVYEMQDFDLFDSDPRPNRELMESALAGMGAYYRVVNNLDAFVYEMRSDRYNVFILTTDAESMRLSDEEAMSRMFQELKSRIHKGDSLITNIDYAAPEGKPWLEFQGDFEKGKNPALGVEADLFKYGQGSWIRIQTDLVRNLQAAVRLIMPVQEMLNRQEVTDFRLTLSNLSAVGAVVHLKELLPDGGWIKTSTSGSESELSEWNVEVPLGSGEEKQIDYLYRLPSSQNDFSIGTVLETTWTNGLVERRELRIEGSAESDLIGLLNQSASFSLSVSPDESVFFEPLEETLQTISLTPDVIDNPIVVEENINALLDMNQKFSASDEDLKLSLDESVELLGIEFTMHDLNRADPTEPSTGVTFDENTTQHAGGGCSLIP